MNRWWIKKCCIPLAHQVNSLCCSAVHACPQMILVEILLTVLTQRQPRALWFDEGQHLIKVAGARGLSTNST